MMSVCFLKPKSIEHLLFAGFSGSVAMAAVQRLSADLVGPYQYLIAFGTSATCNLLWLMSIALFRKDGGLRLHHYLVAISISLLVVTSYSIDLFTSLGVVAQGSVSWLDKTVQELTTLISSTILMLTLWETIKGYSTCSSFEKKQRALFATGFFVAIFNCTVVAKALIPQELQATLSEWFVVTSALIILSSTCVVIIWRHRTRAKSSTPAPETVDEINAVSSEDQNTFNTIETLMLNEQMYLQPDLKMMMIASQLSLPEYKISQAIRSQSGGNFNQFVNKYRIAHAKQLLTDPKASESTILSIGLDSGFGSIAPFNRAFKAQLGCTPKEYRIQNAT
jgi:AraC-like DNA-binding protein